MGYLYHLGVSFFTDGLSLGPIQAGDLMGSIGAAAVTGYTKHERDNVGDYLVLPMFSLSSPILNSPDFMVALDYNLFGTVQTVGFSLHYSWEN